MTTWRGMSLYDYCQNNPEKMYLLKEWDYEKNNEEGHFVESTAYKTTKRVHWKCAKGHTWVTNVAHRVNGSNCPFCYSHTSINESAIFLALKDRFEEVEHRVHIDGVEFDIFIKGLGKSGLAIEYDGAYYHKGKEEKDLRKNRVAEKEGFDFLRVKEYGPRFEVNSIKLERNTCYVSKEVASDYVLLCKFVLGYLRENFKIPVDVEVDAEIESRARLYINKEEKENSLAVKFPEIAKEWDYEKNKGLTPENFSYGSSYKAWWLCPHGHSYRASIEKRTRSAYPTGCPICAGKQALKGFNAMFTVFEGLEKYWDYDRNTVDPNTVTYGSYQIYFWVDEDGKSYQATPSRASAKFKITEWHNNKSIKK